jgi:penicillin G amidase
MKYIRRALLVIGILLLVIVVVVAAAGVYVVRRPWPKTKGTLTVAGLTAPVKVIRDKWGVPQIYAENEHDLFFVQGYVHAQDRLWQMEFNRRVGSGTLSAVLGDTTLDIDRFMRTLGLRRAAERDLAQTGPETRSILEAYAAGVNAFVDSHRSRLPLEFAILGIDPAPWTPLDTLTWAQVMTYDMSYNYRFELLRARLIADLGEEAAQQLMPPYAAGAPLIVPAEAAGYGRLRGVDLSTPAALTALLGASNGDHGSNSWVVHGSRTATARPLLANDTHLGLNMPAIWYENGLQGGRFDVVGYSLPGCPGVMIGHNAHIAWGITILPADAQDFYIEKLDDPQNPAAYEFEGTWQPLERVPETIEVKGSEPVQLDVLRTRHGPLMNGVIGSLKDAEPMALRWTSLEGNRVAQAIVLLNLASGWDDFRHALSFWDAPSQNFVYADVEGHIGYQAQSRIPIRAPGHQGLVPVPGWTGAYEWQGYIPFDELPSVLDPAAGFVVTANNKVISDSYPYHLAYEWAAPYRAQRIVDLLAAEDSSTVEGMQKIQADTYSLPAEALRPYLQAVQAQNDLQAQALHLVNAWDLYLEADRAGASVYQAWYWFLVQNTLRDELGHDLLETYLDKANIHVPVLIDWMAQPDNVWFDDTTTPAVESRDDIVQRSFSDAVSWLSQQYGGDPDKWEWGELHPQTFVHQPLGQSGIGLIESLFNARPIAARGDLFTVDCAWFSYDAPFAMTGGVSQRFIADPGDWDGLLAIHTTGQNGHLFHRHREDMIASWQSVDYGSLPFSREAAEAQAEEVLELQP